MTRARVATLALAGASMAWAACDDGAYVRPASPTAGQNTVKFERLGPVRLPAGYALDLLLASEQMAVRGAVGPRGRVIAASIGVGTPALALLGGLEASPDSNGSVYLSTELRVAAKRLDTSDEWTFLDPFGDLEPTTPTLERFGGAVPRPTKVTMASEAGALLQFEVEEGKTRALGADLAFDDPAEGALGDPLAACGGAATSETRTEGGDDSPRTMIVLKQKGGETVRPAVVPQLRSAIPGLDDSLAASEVEVPAIACCDGELVWAEIHPPAGVTRADLDTTPNHALAISVQGAKSGPIGVDVLPGLVGENDVIFLAKVALGCLGGAPVVAVALNNIKHPNELWFALPESAGKGTAPPAAPTNAAPDPMCSSASPVAAASASAPAPASSASAAPPAPTSATRASSAPTPRASTSTAPRPRPRHK